MATEKSAKLTVRRGNFKTTKETFCELLKESLTQVDLQPSAKNGNLVYVQLLLIHEAGDTHTHTLHIINVTTKVLRGEPQGFKLYCGQSLKGKQQPVTTQIFFIYGDRTLFSPNGCIAE